MSISQLWIGNSRGVDRLDYMQFGKLAVGKVAARPDKVWIQHECGEGGEFDAAEFELHIQRFLEEKF